MFVFLVLDFVFCFCVTMLFYGLVFGEAYYWIEFCVLLEGMV